MGKTSNSKLLKYIFSLLILSLTSSIYGQLNFKVGYTFAYSNLDKTAEIFDRFNALNPQAEKQLKPTKAFHGIDLGLRYRFEHIGFDIGISSISGSTEALNVMQANGGLGKDEWKISMVNYHFGLENYFGVFGYGGTIGIQKLKYRTDYVSSEGKQTIFDESVLSSKFYLIFEVPSNKIAFSLRPYIATTWEPFNLQSLEKTFDPQSTIPPSELEQDILIYGISFVFYNGRQRR